jgi:hypothetical protein
MSGREPLRVLHLAQFRSVMSSPPETLLMYENQVRRHVVTQGPNRREDLVR